MNAVRTAVALTVAPWALGGLLALGFQTLPQASAAPPSVVAGIHDGKTITVTPTVLEHLLYDRLNRA